MECVNKRTGFCGRRCSVFYCMQKRLLIRPASSGPSCFRKAPASKSPWAIGSVLAALLVVGISPAVLRADETLDSGTTTVSTGTNFGVNLYVGTTGTATLNLTGGLATNTDGYLGFNSGGDGTATVSSGTWANSGDLTVGAIGTGTLTQGTHGTINLNAGGTLQIGTGDTTGVLGVDALTNNGTLIFNSSDASTYSGIISGTGSVTKQGGGTLTFDGANSYSGLTTISGGTLALSGTGSLGTGGLSLGTGGSFDIAALASGTYSLPSTGNLTGSGTLSGNGHTLAVLGAFLLGNSPGTVTVDTGFMLDLSGATSTTFDIANPLFTAGTYDLVNGNGSVHFGSVLNLIFSGGTYNNGTDVLQLFINTGVLDGSFSSVNSTGLAAGQNATFNATSGFISVVPEPSTYALTAIGAAIVGLMHRRKRWGRSGTAKLIRPPVQKRGPLFFEKYKKCETEIKTCTASNPECVVPAGTKFSG